jgi:hypothetical protein
MIARGEQREAEAAIDAMGRSLRRHEQLLKGLSAGSLIDLEDLNESKRSGDELWTGARLLARSRAALASLSRPLDAFREPLSDIQESVANLQRRAREADELAGRGVAGKREAMELLRGMVELLPGSEVDE